MTKFFVGLTLNKELIADALEEERGKIRAGVKNLGEICPECQTSLGQKISKLVKILIWEFFEKDTVHNQRKKTRSTLKKKNQEK